MEASLTGDDGSDRFMGHKERRRSSAAKALFVGDYIGAQSNAAIVKMIGKNGDKSILFADLVVKVNKRNKMQERIFLVTDQALYNIDPGNYKCKRRIAIGDVGSISLSPFADNFFAIHIPQEYDYLMVSSKKVEIVTKICEAYKALKGIDTTVIFSTSFEFRIDNDLIREIVFTKVEGGVNTQIFTKQKQKK
eukprot:TRINITY_DN1618_c0_g4_i1.p1 TRINITY_DN1618_c0_g4~~TRINITY_DN1618_c0_g4_i1.p1  ORF type:complete len:192 (-),score=54.25 TRINITY_DN1618_c0_g4_i1:334-909(-)